MCVQMHTCYITVKLLLWEGTIFRSGLTSLKKRKPVRIQKCHDIWRQELLMFTNQLISNLISEGTPHARRELLSDSPATGFLWARYNQQGTSLCCSFSEIWQESTSMDYPGQCNGYNVEAILRHLAWQLLSCREMWLIQQNNYPTNNNNNLEFVEAQRKSHLNHDPKKAFWHNWLLEEWFAPWQ